MLKIWKAEVVESVTGNPGEILAGFVVAPAMAVFASANSNQPIVSA